jgi:hypothetical protein
MTTPKIKIAHLLLSPGSPGDIPDHIWNSVMFKQQQSIDAFRGIADNFAVYSQYHNNVNRTELPVDNCADPAIIRNSTTNFDVTDGAALTYGHYGAYKAHSSAINDFGDYDALLVVEGDISYSMSPDEFTKVIYDAYEYALQRQISIVTFGEVRYGWGSLASAQNTEIIYNDQYKRIDHFLNTHCYLIMRSERESIQRKILVTGWHSWDIWMYWNYDRRSHIISTLSPAVYEIDGYSAVDYSNKSH